MLETEFINNFHFLRPLWLIGFLPLIFLAWGKKGSRNSPMSWRDQCDEKFLPYLGVSEIEINSRSHKTWLIVLIVSLALLALAGPAWQKLPQPVFKKEQARVFVLDMSLTMMATDIVPSRLERAKLKLIDMLDQAKEGQSALVVYADVPYVVSPLTNDAQTISAMVPTLTTDLLPAQGNNTAGAIKRAIALLDQSNVSTGSIILIADGVSEDAADMAAEVVKHNYKLDILATATQNGAPISLGGSGFLKDKRGAIVIPKLDRSAMLAVARAGGGKFVQLRLDDTDTKELMRDTFVSDIRLSSEESKRQTDLWQEEGPWLVLILLPLVAFGFRKGGFLTFSILFMLIPPDPAMAFGWQDLWSNKDQQASSLMQNKDYTKAADLFEDKEWKAAANFRAGKYKEASENFSDENAEGLYNKANALAHMGKLDEAIASYEEALKKQPQFADAKFNLDLLKKLKDKQQQQQQQESNKNKDDQKNQNQQQNQDNQQSQSDQNQENQNGGEKQHNSQNNDSEKQSDKQQANENKSEDAKNGQQANKGNNDSEKNQSQNLSSKKPEDSDKQQNMQNVQQAQQDKQNATKQDNEHKKGQVGDKLYSEEYKEERQAMEQWLRRIPDDPGGLLRQKFLLQHRMQEAKRNAE